MKRELSREYLKGVINRRVIRARLWWWRQQARFMPGLYKPYQVVDGTVDWSALQKLCRDVRSSLEKLGLTNSFSVYERLMLILGDRTQFDVRPLGRIMEPSVDGRVIVALRHDLDADPCTAIHAAKLLTSHGMPGSFYLLHTSGYYGYFHEDVFHRHPAVTDVVRQLSKTNCEIGLHTDPLSIYLDHGVDGAAAVKKEIQWLRKNGATICGTTAHNSAQVYGAENFEIFRGRSVNGRRSVSWKGKVIPLQRLSERRLGLHYEGNYPVVANGVSEAALSEYLMVCPPDAVRAPHWQRRYFIDNPIFKPAYDVSSWLVGRDAWILARHSQPDPGIAYPVTTDTILCDIQSMNPRTRIVVNMHPEYVSADI